MAQAKHGYSEIDPTVKDSKGTTKCGIFKLGTTSTTNVVLFVVLQASKPNPSTFDFILSKQSLDYARIEMIQLLKKGKVPQSVVLLVKVPQVPQMWYYLWYFKLGFLCDPSKAWV